jgi:transcription elongation factor/antiterminator RfaH
MTYEELKRAWYVLYTKSHFENIVDEGLRKKSFEVFLPKIKVVSKRKDRKIILNSPLFSGYIFIKTNFLPSEHLEIIKTPGVVRFVGNKQGPVPVKDETIESLKIMVSVGTPVTTGKKLKKGDRVMVISGPFTGIIGDFVRYRGKSRIIVNIDALGQFAGVDIEEEDVERLPEILL